jgi:Zn ribbon nucleic-acid-binding protein
MACDDDCPGDTRDPVMMEVLIALVETVRCGYVHREPPTPKEHEEVPGRGLFEFQESERRQGR